MKGKIIMNRKEVTPKETINRIENLLKEIGLEYTIISEINNCDLFFSVQIAICNNGLIITSNGKGMTRDLALASGLAELMERLQSRNGMKFWYSIKDYPKKAFIHEYLTQDSIDESFGSDFDDFKGSKLYQYRINYTNAKTNKNVSVPNRIVNLVCGSNGLCAGNSKSEAIVQGVCEIFERYIQKIISRDHIRCPYIRKDSLLEYSFFNKMHCFEENGLSWEILDCTNENRFPVIGLLLVDKKIYVIPLF